MWTPYSLFISAVIFSAAVEAVTLIEALQGAGASDFAAQIESDPTVSALFSSSQVQTVFAPIDGSVVPPSQRKAKRQNFNTNLQYHAISQFNNLGEMSEGSGKPMESLDNTANLGGAGQSVVSNPLKVVQNNTAKRWVSRSANTTSQPSLLNIFTGLGKNVSIIQADIPYDGGLVHVVDSYFTLPEALSTTAMANGHTAFANLGNSSGMSSTIDNTPAITCFVPSNAAFSAPNATSNYNSSASLLSGHIVPNFVGYLPSLVNGATFTTQGGTNITVTVQGTDFFINNAKIIASNQILQNGVAHVIDSIIVPSPSVLIPFTGSASSMWSGTTQIIGLLVSALSAFVTGLLI